MSINDTLKQKRQEILGIARRYGARNVRIFGSVARGEARPESDVDFLVEMEPGRSLFDMGALLVALATMILIRLLRTPQGQLAVDRSKLRAPFLGDLIKRISAAFFAKTLGTLLNNGVPLVAALRVVTTAVPNRYMAQALGGVQTEVEKGQPLSAMLKKVGLLPELFLQMVAIGEETGHLGEMLLTAADSLENDARAAVQRLMALLEPFLILIMSLVVAFIIVSLLMPILNLYEIQF